MPPAKVLAFACLFEGALLVVAYGLGWIVGVDPLAALSGGFFAFAIGLAAVLPMLLLLWWGLRNPGTAMGRATGEARQFVRQFFNGIGPAGFLLVSLLAGLCEEALFRGLLQVFIAGHSSVLVGLVAASVLFGLAHAVSLAYAVTATIIGVYLGALFLLTGSLAAPVICHAVYDFIALLWLSRLPATSR
ncbi:MAG: CPBP family intramembrane metalloprotease [Gammaproteobacteria bacterium]|nr:CPBP family intramembrane metalloprotease [Gammaproteobacteria bacterium]NNF61184.1 CPBP family intramembrane metalloprotease [Gammaproteobacteria bacterium]NNM19879.1 CPBP family intramembrane metalloprotease [Gammaproteobacteria bacterium]